MENLEILEKLWALIEDRKKNPTPDSYTCKLLESRQMLFEKLDEELAEIVEAVMKEKTKGKDSLTWEAADFLYHLLVLISAENLELDDVLAELKKRMK